MSEHAVACYEVFLILGKACLDTQAGCVCGVLFLAAELQKNMSEHAVACYEVFLILGKACLGTQAGCVCGVLILAAELQNVSRHVR